MTPKFQPGFQNIKRLTPGAL